METNGAGFHTSSTGYWEAETDGAVTAKHECSQTLSAIVSVYWVDSQTHNVPAPAEEAFEPAVVKDLADKQISEVVAGLDGYDHKQCAESAKALMGGLTKSLVGLKKPFKYIGACCSPSAEPASRLERVAMPLCLHLCLIPKSNLCLCCAVSCTFLQRLPTAANECGPFGAWEPKQRATEQAEGAEEAALALPEEGAFKVQGAAAGGFYTTSSALWDTSTDGSATAWRDISAGKGMRCIVTVHACYEGQYAAQRPRPKAAEGEGEGEGEEAA